jgi:hypothetical protein
MVQRLADLAGRRLSVPALVIISALLAGCSGNGPLMTSSRGATIAFESIDGLPEVQFQKLVRSLAEEAETRQLAVVPRESSAQFRARGYAAAQLRGKRTVIAWVWDVYDADQQRALRISGEEPATGGQRGWASADDQTLRRIARESLTQLAGFLTNPNEPLAPTPERATPAAVVAAAEEDSTPKTSARRPVRQSIASYAAPPDAVAR